MAGPNERPRIAGELSGIIEEFEKRGRNTLITEKGMAEIFERCERTIQRAVARGELPPPVRMFGKNTWTAGAVIDHVKTRLEESAKEQERLEHKIRQLSP